MGSWFYLFPSPVRLLEGEGAATLLDLAAAASRQLAEEEGAALALAGEGRGRVAEIAPPGGGFPRTPLEMQRLAVDARRRGAILVGKLNLEFVLLGFLEIRESTAFRLLERAAAMAPPGTLVEMVRISPNPEAEMGLAVAPVKFVEGMRILRSRVPGGAL
jgi:hypothetical protein